jgi:O-antigen/teichoic acid export membrane protein
VQSRKLEQKEIDGIAGFAILANAAAGLLIILIAPLVAAFYSEPRLMWLLIASSIYFLASGVTTVPQALAYRDMQFKRLAIIDLTSAALSSGATLSLALTGAGVWSLLIGNLVLVTARGVMLTGGRMPRASFSREGLRRHIEFGSALTLLRLASQAISQSDIFIAGRLLTQQAVGLYSVSLHLATMPMQKIMSTINQVALPAVARLQDEPERLQQRMLEASRLLVLTTAPLLWGMSATAPDLIAVLLGSKWLPASYPLRVVCLVVPLQLLLAIFTTAALGVRDLRANLQSLLATGVIFPLGFFIGARWGINGLANAWLVIMPLVFVIRMPGTMSAVGVTPRRLIRAVWRPFLAASVMLGAVMTLATFLPPWLPVVRLAVLVSAGVAIYAAAVWIFDRSAYGAIWSLVGRSRHKQEIT